MSKQSEAKLAQEYVKSRVGCETCKHYSCEKHARWKEDINLRCIIGGFAVTKRGWCKLWEIK
jgi:hypothetical protein